MRRRYRSIQQKIFLLILPICLVPAMVFLVLTGWGSRLTFEEAMAAELNRRAAFFTERLDLFLADRVSQLLSLARQSEAGLIDYRVSDADPAILDAVIYLGPDDYISVQSITVAANVLFRQYLQIEDFLTQGWVQRGQLNEQGNLDELRLSIPGRLHPVRLLVLTVRDPGQGVMLFVMDVERLMEQFRQTLTHVPEQYVVYSSRGGVVFSSTPLGDVIEQSVRTTLASAEGGHGHFVIRTPSRSLLMAPAKSQFLGSLNSAGRSQLTWMIILPYNMESYLGPHDTLIWLSILITLVLVLVILALAAYASRRLVEPLKRLRHQAEALAHGDLNVRVSVPHGDEIGDLAEAFNAMSSRLRATYRTLEDRIEENRLRAEHINVINEITNAIIRTLSLDSLFDIIKSEISKVAPYDAMWIALYDAGRKDLRLKHITPDTMTRLFDGECIPSKWSLHQRVVDSCEAMHLELGPHHRSELFEVQIFRAEGLQSFLIAPLPSRKGVMGTLTVASRSPHAYNMQLVEVLASLASTVAISIEQAEMFRHISQFANDLERQVATRSQELEVATGKLVQTEKYFAMGRMAGNLAHEINNPLGIIKNYLELVRGSMRKALGGSLESDPQLRNIEIINEEVNRIARLVGQMLDLHRPVEQEVGPVDLSEMVEKLLSIMAGDLEMRHVEVTADLARDLPRPQASPDLIRQVMLNLIRNAEDAMGETGGTLSVRTTAVSEWQGGRERTIVHLRVADTGPGIAPECLPQLFDPFFTTKSLEEGTGLGLYVSYSIAQMYRGSLEAENLPGGGAVFTLTLPVSDGESGGGGMNG